jgi:hypothetical protein
MTGVDIRRARGGIRRHRHKHVIADADTLPPVFVEHLQFCPGRLRRDAVLQSADHAEDVSTAMPGGGRVQPQRQPDLRPDIHDIGARRHDADHFAAPAVHFHHSPDDWLPSERGLPQLVRENRDRRQRCLRILPGGFSAAEQPSLSRPQAERLEQMLVDVDVTHAPGPVVGSQIHLARTQHERPNRRK